MFVVGLTGGIGSGKSAASQHFEALGIKVVDADIVAREVVEPKQPALAAISKQFGPDILLANGCLNRPKLREIIFTDTNAKNWLESLLHPLIRTEILRQLSLSQSAYAVLVSPLLFEANQNQLCSRTLLIDAPESLQIERACARDATSKEHIQKIIDAQATRESKRKLADDIIVNDQDLAHLRAEVKAKHEHYLDLAKQ